MKYKKLTLITLIGIFLRLVFLFHHDLWFDEAISILISRLSIPDLLTAASFDNNPPLYYLILHFWMQFSQNTFWLRSLSLIFSSASIPLVFLTAKKLFSLRTAILASLLMTLMPVQLYYSGEIRFYSLTILLSTIIFYLVLSHQEKSSSNSPSFLLICSVTALLTTHYSGLLVVLAVLLLTLKEPIILRNQIWINSLIGLMFALPWFIFSIGKPHPPAWTPDSILSLAFMPITATFGLTGSSPKFVKKTPLIIPLAAVILILILTNQKIPFLSPRLIIPFTPLIYIFLAESLRSNLKIRSTYLILISLSIMINFTPQLKGPKIIQALEISQKANAPILHTSISTYYPAKIITPSNLSYYIGPRTFPKALTSYLGDIPKKLNTILPSQNIILLIDNNNTDSTALKYYIEQINRTHTLTKEKSTDQFIIQTYNLKIYPEPSRRAIP
jgi:4-amino-4-deoxy-L-arabinose transferase-like glycosyltransferase